MPVISVDGRDIEVKAGSNLLEACLNAGLDVPYFCWHPAMGSIGSCRQCAVVQYQGEDDKRGKIVMGCMTPVADGARFSLEAETGSEFRQAVVESLMLNHPHDCPVCAEGGECHLQDMTVMVGHRDRRYRGRKNTHRNQYLGPLIHHEMNRCITCYRCVRYYRDYAGGTDLSAQASHDHTYFGRHQEGVLESEFSGNLVEVCPTGVFTDKPLLKHYTRKWDLQSAPSICTGCAVGCNTAPGERYGKLKRVHNRYHHEVNGYFLCDRGRFGLGYVNGERRLNYAGQRQADQSFAAIAQPAAVALAGQWIRAADNDNALAGIGSPRASMEANFLLRELVGADNFYPGFGAAEEPVIRRIAEIVTAQSLHNPSIKQIEAADAILILGEDITHTAPRVALALRQAVRNKALDLADEARLFHWQDAAVRNLAQDQRSPLVIVSASDTRLDDVASEVHSLAPNAIAQFGQSVAAAITGNGEPANDAAASVAAILSGAKNPLIIGGSSMLNIAIVDAALAVAQALERVAAGQQQNDKPRQCMLSYTLPEANSLGLALLVQPSSQGNAHDSAKGDLQGSSNTLLTLLQRANAIDTLVVLENDLTRRLSPAQCKQLLDPIERVLVIDLLEQQTMEQAALILPAASVVESEGSLINSEGRAQRHYPVFEPLHERQASWRWLLALAAAAGREQLSVLQRFDEVTTACAASNPLLAGLVEAAPDHSFRQQGQKVPRQTHRNSGRTAVLADQSVHEPQQLIDSETPLAYTMEGFSRDEPAALKPFYWAPGWNSNQSLQKFQAEVDGPLHGGNAGRRLFEVGIDAVSDLTKEPLAAAAVMTEPAITESAVIDTSNINATAATDTAEYWQLVPVYRLHGSEELSVVSEEIAELAGEAFVAISAAMAAALAVVDGDGLQLRGQGLALSLAVKVLPRLAAGAVGYSAGFMQTVALQPGAQVTLIKDNDWQRAKPQLIASDRGGAHG